MNLTEEEVALRVDVFWETLGKNSIEQVEEAFQWARESLPFFPKPVELTDHITRESNEKYLRDHPKKGDEEYLISWMEPSEEGKKLAIEMFDDLKKRWAKEDEEKAAQRRIEFERRRRQLKKQARLLK